MFICPKCSSNFELPKCNVCENTIEISEGIWQFSNDPDMVIDGDSDKYIGYEYIGENYSGNRKYIIEEKDLKTAKELAKIVGNGIFLDLACGDGCLTVPLSSLGVKVIAADISRTMLKVLLEKADRNGVNLDNTIICRINALKIPIEDNSIDCIMANGVLHLISNPEKVIKEVHRVLKPNGVFICLDDAPGKESITDYDNSKYNEIVNALLFQYWTYLKEHNVFPKHYSWKFDRDAVCGNIFSKKETLIIEHNKKFSRMMKDDFLPRFLTRGFSDQIEVMQNDHQQAVSRLLPEIKNTYGDDFDEKIYNGIEHDILLTIYSK